jgi:hypothetical protein
VLVKAFYDDLLKGLQRASRNPLRKRTQERIEIVHPDGAFMCEGGDGAIPRVNLRDHLPAERSLTRIEENIVIFESPFIA